MKILCVCEGGNVRSVALAYALKHEVNPRHDALAMGLVTNNPDTQLMLFNWAERIIVMEERLKEPIPPIFHSKVSVCEVGPDRYGIYVHPDLIKLVREYCQKRY